MFLLRAHYFVSGGLAYCFRHGRSRYTVLGCSYPVRNALPRHLRSLTGNKRLLHTHKKIYVRFLFGIWAFQKKKTTKENKTSTPSATLPDPLPSFYFPPPWWKFKKKKKIKTRLWQTRTRGGRNKEKRILTTTTIRKGLFCFFLVAPRGSAQLRVSGMPWSQGPLADSSDPGLCLALIPMWHTGSLRLFSCLPACLPPASSAAAAAAAAAPPPPPPPPAAAAAARL